MAKNGERKKMLTTPANIKKMLDAQQVAINANVDAKATETKTEVTNKAVVTQNLVSAENVATKTLVSAENDATQATLESLGTAASLDANVLSINNHVTSESSRVLANSGGVFVPDYIGVGIQRLSAVGTIPITPPDGHRVRLTNLSCDNTGLQMRITLGGVALVTGSLAGNGSVDGTFVITTGSGVAYYQNSGTKPVLIGGVNETILLTTTVTAGTYTYYSYDTGRIR
ncbi:MAG: hypothetical protein ACI9LM_000103 [Alteromonadaceae bacterium]